MGGRGGSMGGSHGMGGGGGAGGAAKAAAPAAPVVQAVAPPAPPKPKPKPKQTREQQLLAQVKGNPAALMQMSDQDAADTVAAVEKQALATDGSQRDCFVQRYMAEIGWATNRSYSPTQPTKKPGKKPVKSPCTTRTKTLEVKPENTTTNSCRPVLRHTILRVTPVQELTGHTTVQRILLAMVDIRSRRSSTAKQNSSQRTPWQTTRAS